MLYYLCNKIQYNYKALFVFIAIISLLIGYASISDILLAINGNVKASINQSNFNVKFIQETNVSPKINPSNMGTATIVDDTTSTFNISGNMRKGDSVVVTYKIKNDSNGIGADIDLSLINSNTEYYQVTETITDKQLQAGETTTATVTVEMIENQFEID